uniref:G-protein coupled receptors family 3 profile domain-containing protein n=1 Tax=Mucochytrium quahogii TaxID=96639 RepID=A0A7S2SEB0_9STRA
MGVGSHVAGTILLSKIEVQSLGRANGVASLILEDFRVGSSNTVVVNTTVTPGGDTTKVEYNAVQTSSSGGLASWTKTFPALGGAICNEQLEFSVFNARKQSLAGRAKFQIGLIDEDGDPLETSDWSLWSDANLLDSEASWKTYSLSVGTVVNDVSHSILPLNKPIKRIMGLKIEFMIDNTGSIGSESSGEIVLSPFRCTGRAMFGSEFGVANGVWGNNNATITLENFNSEAARANTELVAYPNGLGSFRDPVYSWKYSIERSAAWGGFTSLAQLLPGNVAYDFSNAEFLTLWFNNIHALDRPGQAHLRLILYDAASCTESCDSINGVEVFYSFNHILDMEPGWNLLRIPLIGDDNSDSPFYRTGWSGSLGDNTLGLSRIKGFALELSVGSGINLNSRVNGEIQIGRLSLESPVVADSKLVVNPFFEWPIEQDTNTSVSLVLDGNRNVTKIDYVAIENNSGGGDAVVTRMLNQEETLDCKGATTLEISISNVVKQTSPGKADIRVYLLQGESNTTTDMEYFGWGTPNILDSEPGWQVVRIYLGPLENGIPSASLSHDKTKSSVDTKSSTNPNHFKGDIRGVQIAFSIKNSDSFGSQTAGTVNIDSLRCSKGSSIGNGHGITDVVWEPISFNSPTATNETRLVRTPNGYMGMPHPVLQWEYTVEQSAVWGGFSAIRHILDPAIQYDAGSADHLSLWYYVEQAQSTVGSAHFRVILFEGDTHNTSEFFYSFNNILDDQAGWKQLTVPLIGDENPDSPFYLTGWFGIKRDGALDRSAIKGILFEISVGSSNGLGSLTRGKLLISNVEFTQKAVQKVKTIPPCHEFANVFLAGSNFKLVEFAYLTCCTECAADPECLFTKTSRQHCWLVKSVKPEDVQLKRPDKSFMTHKWTEDKTKLGHICEKCICDESKSNVDCSGRGFQQIPLFEGVSPTKLDLSNNLELSFIVDGRLQHLDKLDTVKLQNTSLRYVSHTAFPDSLKTVDVDTSKILNLATGKPGRKSFSDICCERQISHFTNIHGEPLYFCTHINENPPCADCMFEPYIDLFDEDGSLKAIRESDVFGDAAKDPGYCGELCTLTKNCKYFTLDVRQSNSESTCYLKTSDIGRRNTTDNPKDWKVDGDQAAGPGYISGYTGRTRGLLYNATVSMVGLEQVTFLNESTGYPISETSPPHSAFSDMIPVFTITAQSLGQLEYGLKLDSRPTRGAVWIYPQITFVGVPSPIQWTINPSKVVIYPDEWNQTHMVRVDFDSNNLTGGVNLELSHDVDSCDQGFISNPDQPNKLRRRLFMYMNLPKEDTKRVASVKIFASVLCILNTMIAFGFTLWTFKNRKHAVVRASQAEFLGLISIGAILSSLAIYPMTVDDTDDVDGLALTGGYGPANLACNMQVWLYSLGFVTSFAPLFAKTLRLKKITEVKNLRRVHMSNFEVAKIIFFLQAIEVAIIVAWMRVAPLQYKRDVHLRDTAGNPLESSATCKSENDTTPFLVMMFLFHVIVLIMGNYMCYSVKYLSGTVLSEGKYVSVAMFSNFQVLALAAPLLVIVADDPVTSLFVRSGVIFLNDLTTQTLIYVPKILAVYTGHYTITPSSEKIAPSTETNLPSTSVLPSTSSGVHRS